MLLLLIDVALTAGHGGRPLIDSWIYTGSDIVFCVQGVPRSICGMTIRSVSVTITNADGVAVTVIGTLTDDGWVGRFPASHFERFGSVVRGVCVRGLGRFGGEDSTIVLGIGGLHIKPGTAEVQPGAALKDAGASVKLHALTSEVADTTVTLKPVDGAANHVGEPFTVMRPDAESGVPSLVSLQVKQDYWVSYEGDSGYKEAWATVAFDFSSTNARLDRVAYPDNVGSWGYGTRFDITILQDTPGTLVDVTRMNGTPEDYLGDFPAAIGDAILMTPGGSLIEVGIVDLDVTSNTDQDILLNPPGNNDSYAHGYLGECISLVPELEKSPFAADELSITGHIRFSAPKAEPYNLRVAIPASTDTAKARRFSLAVETDAGSEMAVEWQGGEVIEAAPGASNLVPGLTVWDVAEVAPGKFKVERASGPAQSAPLTLIAPNGRVAELTVGDDLVLEVKEK